MRLATIALLSTVAGACGKPDRERAATEATSAPTAPVSAEHVAEGCSLPARVFERPAAERVVAIGDLHGDLSATRDALRAGGAIDPDGNWVGGELVVVQTGDILDRGDDEVEIYAYLESLARQAAMTGGAVIALNGNHEFMNAEGDMSYVTAGGFADFAASGDETGGAARRSSFAPGGDFAVRLAALDVVTMVGDNIFVHGGIEPRYARMDLGALNREARCWLAGQARSTPGFLTDDGPVWSRRFSLDPPDCAALKIALEALGAKRMVIGHTPQPSGISSACGGAVWRIDVGLSRHYGGPIEVLELRGQEVNVLRGTRSGT